MTILLEHWDLVLFILLFLFIGVYRVIKLIRTPSEKRQELLLMWLVQAVTQAEKQFNSKTGSIKLSYVYDLFIKKYGILGKFVSKELFEKLVNKAIRIMEETIENKQKELPK